MSAVHLCYDGHGANWSTHGGFDASDLCGSPPGLSGTELPMFGMAFELAKHGHEVSIYSRFRNIGPRGEGEVRFCDLDEPHDECDIAIAFHDGRPLDRWRAKRKVLALQTFLTPNRQQDATYTGADFADIYITTSEHVADHLRKAYGWPDVRVVPNAWDLGEYQPWDPVPGRMIYTTSLERGFHRLLEAFPFIREKVPHAHIVVFERGGPAVEDARSHPVAGVTLVKAASRNDVLAELARAAVYAYPCAPPSPTEVFPVSLLEACATGVPIVLAPADGIEKIFAPGVILTPPVHDGNSRGPFVDATVRMLTDEEAAREQSERGKAFAEPYRFEKTTRILMEVLGL